MASSRLSSLLNDLGDCLTTASDSSTSPQGSDAQLHTRMRTVLVSLLAECINSKSGTSEPQSCPLNCYQSAATASFVTTPSGPAVKERELVTLLNLVNMALQRIPRIVSDDDGATLLTIIGQTTSLLAEERLACVLPNMLLLRPHTESFCIAVHCTWYIRIWSPCRNIHSYLLKTLQSMAGILVSINTLAYASICSGAGELISGASTYIFRRPGHERVA